MVKPNVGISFSLSPICMLYINLALVMKMYDNLCSVCNRKFRRDQRVLMCRHTLCTHYSFIKLHGYMYLYSCNMYCIFI